MQTQTKLPTKLHRYHFHLTNEVEREAWNKLKSELKAKGHDHFHVISEKPPTWTGKQEQVESVNIETTCIFDNHNQES